MSGFTDPILAGDGSLIRPAAKSPDYTPGSLGWSINRDGTVEFNSGTFRGTISAATIIASILETATSGARIVIDTSNTIKAYDSSGTLIMTISPTTASINITGSIKVINAAQPSFYMLCDGGSITLNDGVVTSGASFSISDGSGNQGAALIVQSPSQTSTQAAFKLIAKSPDGTVNPFMWVKQNMRVSGAVVQADGSGGAATWQTPTYGTGWAGGPSGGSRQALQYRITAEDELWLVGAMHSTSATPNATAFTLPAAFRPLAFQQDVCIENFAGTFTLHELEIDTSGNVSIHPNLSASGHDLYINARFPLGNIA